MTLKILKISLFFIFLVLAVWFCTNNISEFAKLADIPLILLFAIIILHIFQLILNAWIFKLNVLVAGCDLRLSEWIGLRMISQFANMISVFRGGVFASFAYLKFKYRIKISVLLAIFVVNSIFTIYSIIPPLLVVGVNYLYSINIWYSALMVFPISLLILRILFSVVNKIASLNYVSKSDRMKKIISLMSSHQNIWTQVVIVNWVFFYLSAYAFQVCFIAIGADTKFETNFTFVLFSALSNLVSLTPGNFGIQETIIAMTSSRLDNVEFSDGIIVSGIHRIINIVLVSLAATVFARLLLGGWSIQNVKTNIEIGKSD